MFAYLCLPGLVTPALCNMCKKQRAQYADSALPTILMYDAAYTGSKGPPETTPFSKSKLSDLPQFGGQHAEDLLWSTFRPGQYFGEK